MKEIIHILQVAKSEYPGRFEHIREVKPAFPDRFIKVSAADYRVGIGDGNGLFPDGYKTNIRDVCSPINNIILSARNVRNALSRMVRRS